jgi:hypothetical protein
MKVKLLLAASAALLAIPASAADFSFTGNFTQDDNVQLFTFAVGAPSTVTLRTLSYAGGTNAAGQAIARGGFDPILALFDSTGARINQNDDGDSSEVPVDSVTGQYYDTYLQSMLNPGTYTVSVMQYDNFAGDNLSDPFDRAGEGNFTAGFGCQDNQPAFNDVSGVAGCGRDSHWAFDILGVESAAQGVPEPTSWALMIAGFGLAGFALRSRRITTTTQVA